MKLKMHGDLVLTRVQKEMPMAGAIVVSSVEQPTGYHEVVEVGPDVERVRPGQIVLADPGGGTRIKVGSEELVVFRDDQMFATQAAA